MGIGRRASGGVPRAGGGARRASQAAAPGCTLAQVPGVAGFFTMSCFSLLFGPLLFGHFKMFYLLSLHFSKSLESLLVCLECHAPHSKSIFALK